MSQRNTSQIPSEQPKPPQHRSDRLRAGRIAPTGSVRREKEAPRPPMAGRGRGGGTRIARVDAAGGSSSHTGPSQMVDPTQYRVYEHLQGHEYQFQDSQPHQYQFDAYQQHQYHHEEPVVEEPQQHEEAVVEEPPTRFQGVPRVVYEAGPDGYAGGLLTSGFYLTLVDMSHAGYGSMSIKHRVKGISHGKKLSITNLALPMPMEENDWFWDEVNMSGLTPLS